MKVVFAADQTGMQGELGKWLKVAIDSLRESTSHEPVVLADGLTAEMGAWLSEKRVSFMPARTPLANRIDGLNRLNGYPLQAKGNYLRYEAARLLSDEFFFYADCDVVFLRDFALPAEAPRIIGAAPADIPFSYSSFNSGALLFNRAAFLDELPAFYEFAEHNLQNFFPGYDQAALNTFFRGRIDAIPSTLNWRPHWGSIDDAKVLHFHGVKVQVLSDFLEGISWFAGTKREQVLDLAAKTLTHLPFFMGEIDAELISRHPILQTLSRLADRAARLTSSPTLEGLRHGVRVRTETEATMRATFYEETRRYFMEKDTFVAKRISLAPANHRRLRVVVRSASPVMFLSDVLTISGEEVCKLEASISSNLVFKSSFVHRGRRYTHVEAVSVVKPIDLIFKPEGSDYQELQILAMSMTPLRLEYYWADEGEFSAERSRFSDAV